MDRIAIINAASTVTDEDASAWVVALQRQVTEHFEPAWGIPVELGFVPRGARPLSGHWQLGIFDDADQASALGYHDITAEGLPLGKVFARVSRAVGEPISVVLSHELLEMLADPDVNLLVEDARHVRRFWAYESCDAVQATNYLIGDIPVANFVLPEYFETFRQTGPFDHLGHLTHPLPALLPGGYMIYVENGRWRQIIAQRDWGNREQWRMRPHEGGRRHRRILGAEHLVRSTI